MYSVWISEDDKMNSKINYQKDYRKQAAELLSKALSTMHPRTAAELEALIEEPKNSSMGDYAFPCFTLSKEMKKNPAEIAATIATAVTKSITDSESAKTHFAKAEAIGAYVNFFVRKNEFIKHTADAVLKQKDKYGSSKIGKGRKIIIEFSSPNIAKPFGIGHLRSTVIGNSVYRTFSFLGYKCIGINYLGDWGTQFGKLIVAYRKWGSEDKLKASPIEHLYELYVKFHQQAEQHPELEDEARAEFRKMEQGNKENLKIWKKLREKSLEDFNRIYNMLGIKFDVVTGESQYNKKSVEAIEWCKKKGIAVESDGALIIEMQPSPVILLKSDGTTLYATRDIATAVERLKKYNPEKIIYVVGSEQKLHFRQVFAAVQMLGHDSADKSAFEHIDFGLYRFPEGKMSTRYGKIIFMEDVLNKAIELVSKVINEKNPDLKNKEKVAKDVGIGAVVFADLSTDRIRDVVFDWDSILDFEGETGPYVQYTHARIKSLLRKAGMEKTGLRAKDFEALGDEEYLVAKLLHKFPKKIEEAANARKPHIIARYLLDLCQQYNLFYQKVHIIGSEGENARLALSSATSQVLENGLHLLGITAPEEM